MSHILNQAESYLQQALEAHVEFHQFLSKAKERGFDCGCFLLSAQHHCEQELGPGQWETLLASQERIPRTTAFRYMKFARDCLDWMAEQEPRLLKKPDQ